MASRALPHATTGKSRAELLFGRKMRTKLPDIVERPYEENQEVRDRDHENKAKAKLYADNKRNAQHSDIALGDTVLVKQDKQNKLTTSFNERPFTVVSKNGNSVVVQSPTGEQYSRNTTFVKKFHEPTVVPETAASDAVHHDENIIPDATLDRSVVVKQQPETIIQRPTRTVRMPDKFIDYDLK